MHFSLQNRRIFVLCFALILFVGLCFECKVVHKGLRIESMYQKANATVANSDDRAKLLFNRSRRVPTIIADIGIWKMKNSRTVTDMITPRRTWSRSLNVLEWTLDLWVAMKGIIKATNGIVEVRSFQACFQIGLFFDIDRTIKKKKWLQKLTYQ